MSVWKFLLRISIGLVLLAVLLYKQEVTAGQVLAHIYKASPLILVCAVLLYLSGPLLNSYRWALLARLAGYKDTRTAKLWPIYYGAMFFNICLPTSIGGDVLRVVGIGRQMNSKAAGFASVFMDRNVGFAALLAIGLGASLCSLFFTPLTVRATLAGHLITLPLWSLFIFLLLGYFVANALLFNNKCGAVAQRLTASGKMAFFGAKLRKLHDSVQAYRRPLREYARPFALSLIYQAGECCVVWLVAYGLKLDLPFYVFFALVPFQAAAALLPITFSGIGVREGIFCAVLMGQVAQADIKDSALALSLLFFGVMLAASLLGGVIYLFSGLRRPSGAEILEASSGGGQNARASGELRETAAAGGGQ